MSDERVSQIALGFFKGIAMHSHRQVFGNTVPTLIFFGKSAKDRDLNTLPNFILLAK